MHRLAPLGQVNGVLAFGTSSYRSEPGVIALQTDVLGRETESRAILVTWSQEASIRWVQAAISLCLTHLPDSRLINPRQFVIVRPAALICLGQQLP